MFVFLQSLWYQAWDGEENAPSWPNQINSRCGCFGCRLYRVRRDNHPLRMS